jgi:hypothetical protein
MRLARIILLLILFESIFSRFSIAQIQTRIKGRVVEEETGNPVPFANVYLRQLSVGTRTDFDGYYSISTKSKSDSIIVSYVGYKTLTKPFVPGIDQTINFSIEAEVINLREVVLYSGENPAFELLRKVVKNKNANDKRSLDAYEYESYNFIEVDINRIPEKMKESGALKEITTKLDSIYKFRDSNGKRLIPVFISEDLSKTYVKNNPFVKKEEIIKTRVNGLGMEDGNFISQFLGTSFQEYNFYRNWLNILNKEFVSPIADGWKVYYDYDLLDSVLIDNDSCYLLNIIKRNDQDLAFSGKMWITKKDYALKQIDVTVGKSANINYVKSIRIQQTLSRTDPGPWMPSRSRLTIDIAEMGEKVAGFMVKFNNTSRDWIVNKPRAPSFYNGHIDLLPDHMEMKDSFWNINRQDTLSGEDKIAFRLIDTLRNIPVIRKYTGLAKFAATGYIRANKIDYGPALYTYSYNNIEGNRIRLGFRTNKYMSERWWVRMYGAYGFSDQRFKYGVFAGYIFNRKPWMELSVGKRYDIDQVGIQAEELMENHIFLAFTRFGTLSQPFLDDVTAIQFRSEFSRGFFYHITIRRETFDPLYNFAYYRDLTNSGELNENYINSSATFELKYAPDETFVTNGNLRLSLGIRRAPSMSIQYTQGIKGLFGGDFNYKKLVFNFEHRLRLGGFGTSHYRFTAAHVFDVIPYPLLFNHIGNETYFYSTGAYSTLNYFEFVSDSYLSLKYQHDFGGFMLNRIPLMNKLKWRLVGNANILWGHMSVSNKNIIPEVDDKGNPIEQFNTLGNTPFIELGYGITNILKCIRIEAFHRLTYLDNENVHPFQIKLSFQFTL